MNNKKINDKKTIEEAKENLLASVAPILSVSVINLIDRYAPIDPTVKTSLIAVLIPFTMGLLKTLIRRLRNRWKHE